MEVGINILDNLRINIGETLNEIENSLIENNISYTIPTPINKTGKSNGSIIMFIETYGVELNIVDGIVTYIKSNNSKLNYVTTISVLTPLLVLLDIKSTLSRRFNIPEESIRIDRFNTKTFDASMSIPYINDTKIRLTVVSSGDRKIHIESIQLVK